MKLFKTLSLRTKLILSHSLIILLALIVAGAGIYSARRAEKKHAEISAQLTTATQSAEKLMQLNTATNALGDLMYATADLQLVTTAMITLPANTAEDLLPLLEKSMNEDVSLMAAAAGTLYTSLAEHPDAIELIEQIGGLIATSGEQRQVVLELKESGDANGAYAAYMMGYRQTLVQIQALASELQTMVEDIVDQFRLR